MNYSFLAKILGRLLTAYAGFMGIPFLVALLEREESLLPFLYSIIITLLLGLILACIGQKEGRMGLREGFVVVAAAWVLTSLTGALPYLFSGVAPNYLDGLFEAVSGLTTTGASVLANVEELPRSILLWRSLTQWLGGMGIIVLFIVILPNVTGAAHLYNAEVPGPTSERILPRIKDNALRLWQIYMGFTVVEVFLLLLLGMNWFDAVNHSLTSLATGGFSTKDSSVMYFNNLGIELVIVLFMLIGGVNFGLYYQAWRLGLKKIFLDAEFRFYVLILAAATSVISLSLWLSMDMGGGTSLRQALFQVVSIMTSTGFSTADFDQWPSLTKLVLLTLMFIGGCAGSTAGGIKVARIVLLGKFAWTELRSLIHPKAIINVRFAGKVIEAVIVKKVAVFFSLFIFVFIMASLLLAAAGLQPFDAMSAAASALGNTGPGFGAVGPATTYSEVSALGKGVLTLCMLLGRLELVTLLVLIQPEFWRSRKGW